MIRPWRDVSVASRGGIYLRAAGTLLLPLGAAGFFLTSGPDVVWQRVGAWRYGGWVGAGVAVLAAVVEWRCACVALGLIQARGSAAAYAVLRKSEAWAIRRRRARYRVLAVAASTVLAFALSEAVFRAFGIRPAPSSPSWAEDTSRVDNTLNAFGFRGRGPFPPPMDGRLRIAFLGDSITYGDGVEYEQTFPYLLQGMLSSDRPSGVVTMNLGICGTSPGYQLGRFLAVREALATNVVVHVVYPNDLLIDTTGQLYRIYRVRDGNLWTGDWSYVLRFAERQLRYWLAWRQSIAYLRGGVGDPQRSDEWHRFQADLAHCKRAVEEGGAVYAVVLFPWLARLDDYPLSDVHALIGEFVAQLGVPYLDLREAFAGHDAERLRVSMGNEHPNAEGHRIAAEAMAQFLRENVLPAVAAQPSRPPDDDR